MSEQTAKKPLLEVKGLKEYFDINMGFFRTKPLKAGRRVLHHQQG